MPLDARVLRVLDLFAGIGGFTLGLEMVGGFRTVGFCEIDSFCRRVLAKHWPRIPCWHDVREMNLGSILATCGQIDVITAGFPCQPASVAGKRLGVDDDRWLWPDLARIIRVVRPRYVILENVSGLFTVNGGRAFGDILGDLAACGFDAEWQVLPASAFGAPHIRRRIWIVAYPMRQRTGTIQQSRSGNGTIMHSKTMAHANSERCAGNACSQSERANDSIMRAGQIGRAWWSAEPDVGRVADGVPARVDRLRSLGNAVVPQVVAFIGQCVLAHAGIAQEALADAA